MQHAEIIIAEQAVAPLAADLAREFGSAHLRLASDGPFERARTLNAGAAVASHDFIVWHDNDLVCGSGFFERAVAEMFERDLDYLIPYTRIEYLSEPDSTAVLQGRRTPQQCRSVRTIVGGRDASGGMGVVHRRFLDRFGGFSQEFRGWGGEDNFWWKKATLLGRAGTTRRADQTLWHLFHPQSVAHTRELPTSEQYRRNVALLNEAARLNTPARFLARFQSRPEDSCRFSVEHGLRFVSARGSEDGDMARAVAAIIGKRFGVTPALADAASPSSGPEALTIVLFGAASLNRTDTSDPAGALLLVISATSLSDVSPKVPAPRLSAVVTDATPEHVASAGLEAAVWRWDPGRVPNRSQGQNWSQCSQGVASALISALSHTSSAETPHTPLTRQSAQAILPVWFYWEGSLPDWIAQCQATIRAHAPSAHFLNPADFELIWDQDRDVDIKSLGPAQRADFIRSFLLQRHGGIWLDSDCLLMKGLDDVQALLRVHDFVAHRDRQGYFPNGFMAAARGSQVAAALYQIVCAKLRSHEPLGWISLGGEALTGILRRTTANWLELPCARIQPVCWSEPEVFFAIADAATHEKMVDRNAITYMLSNTRIVEYQRSNPGQSLLADDTFFRFLLARSLGEPALTAPEPVSAGDTFARHRVFAQYHRAGVLRGEELVSGPGSSMGQTNTIRRALPPLLGRLGVRSLLDAGCGDFNWMRELVSALDRYTGVDLIAELIESNRRCYQSERREFHCLDFAEADLPRADMVLCRDTLVHYSLSGAKTVLRNLQRTGSRYLLATTFPGRGANNDIPLGGWRPLDMEAPPFSLLPPLHLIVENCTEMGGRYADKSLGVWALQDLVL